MGGESVSVLVTEGDGWSVSQCVLVKNAGDQVVCAGDGGWWVVS